MQILTQRKVKKYTVLICIAVMLIHFLPYFILGDQSYIRIHDTMEGELVWLHLLSETSQIWNFDPSATIEPVMNGLRRDAFPTGLSGHALLVHLFGAFKGYIINYFIIHLIGFFSMLVFLKNHVLPEKKHQYIVWMVSLIFSLLPVFGVFGLAIMAQPLVLYAFLNMLKNRDRWWDYLIIVIFPFYSSFVIAGPPLILMLGVIWIYWYFNHKELNKRYLLSIALLGVLYLVANFWLIRISFFSDFVAHRAEYDLTLSSGFIDGLLETIYYFFLIRYHIAHIVILPILIAYLICVFYTKGNNAILNWIFASIIAACIVFGFKNHIALVLEQILPILTSFKIRYIAVLPLLWMTLFALSLARINRDKVFDTTVAVFLGCQLVLVMFSNDEWLQNMRHIIDYPTKPNYQEYVAKEQFDEIEDYIGKPKSSYRVASLGMNPSVAQFNGFYTLDALQSVYPLDYKHQFRKIIEPELEKNKKIRNYFDGWGNRCYILSSELDNKHSDFMIGKNEEVVLKDFEMNISAFNKMGGEYLFSSVEIENPGAANLKLESVFEHENSFWKIYLYQPI